MKVYVLMLDTELGLLIGGVYMEESVAMMDGEHLKKHGYLGEDVEHYDIFETGVLTELRYADTT